MFGRKPAVEKPAPPPYVPQDFTDYPTSEIVIEISAHLGMDRPHKRGVDYGGRTEAVGHNSSGEPRWCPEP